MDRYEVLCALGSGTYGSVSKVCRRCDGRILVLKSIPLDGLCPEDRMETLNEVGFSRPSWSYWFGSAR